MLSRIEFQHTHADSHTTQYYLLLFAVTATAATTNVWASYTYSSDQSECKTRTVESCWRWNQSDFFRNQRDKQTTRKKELSYRKKRLQLRYWKPYHVSESSQETSSSSSRRGKEGVERRQQQQQQQQQRRWGRRRQLLRKLVKEARERVNYCRQHFKSKSKRYRSEWLLLLSKWQEKAPIHQIQCKKKRKSRNRHKRVCVCRLLSWSGI